MDPKERFISWLNSAYAMEQSLAQVLENHVKDAKAFPELSGRLEQHLEETKQHAKLVEGAIRSLGSRPSLVKSVMGNVTGLVQGLSTSVYSDEMVKDLLADFASEHFEIACYTSLIAGAQDLGHTDLVEVFEQIIAEEESMAEWLKEQIPATTMRQLREEALAR